MYPPITGAQLGSINFATPREDPPRFRFHPLVLDPVPTTESATTTEAITVLTDKSPVATKAPVPVSVYVPPPAPAPVYVSSPALISAVEAEEWMKVAICEEGGQNVDGAVYSGMLGISRTNWTAYGGGEFAEDGFHASFDEQVVVAMRIQGSAPPPDQNGCAPW